MNTYNPEVATVLASTAELRIAMVNHAVAVAGICVVDHDAVFENLCELEHITEELKRNEVTVDLSNVAMRAYIAVIYNKVVSALNALDVAIAPATDVCTDIGDMSTTTIVPNLDVVITESTVLDCEQVCNPVAVELTDSEEDTTLHNPVDSELTASDRAQVDAIMTEAHRQASMRVGDIMRGETVDLDIGNGVEVEISTATNEWLNPTLASSVAQAMHAEVPEVEAPNGGKKGSKKRLRN